jgi:citrate lyase subunit beta/citryl-CoA lyase
MTLINSPRRVAEMARTWLFVPGDRPDRFQNAATAGADVIILDLEDAVAPPNKDVAREHVFGWLSTAKSICAVRVNAVGTSWHDADLDALAELPSDLALLVMLPMTEDSDYVAELAARFSRNAAVIALIETALGVINAVNIAKVPGVERLALGSYDLAAQLGIDPDYRPAMAATRSVLVLASAAAGLAGPIDGITGNVRDRDKLVAEVAESAALGFAGKLCIHPNQVADAAAALSPSDADVALARRIIEAFTTSADGVVLIDGNMVDAPVVTRARRILDDSHSGVLE